MCVNGSLLASPSVQICTSPFLLQQEMCLQPYSKPSVCSSEYISFYLILSPYHFPVLIFNLPISLTSYSDMIKSSLSFFKWRNAFDLPHLSASSSPFFLSINQLNKPLAMCVGFLFPKSFLSTQQPGFPFLHLFSDHRSWQGFRWSHFMGTAQPGYCLSPVLPPSPL